MIACGCAFRLGVREVCVHSLLYTESGRALLNIIGTGVDTVEMALASQGRWVLKLSGTTLLNRLLNSCAR